MTLLYKLFGKPRNVGEFADKSCRNGESRVDIVVGDERTELGSGASFHHYLLILKAGTYQLKVAGASALNVFGLNPGEDEVRDLIAQHNALIQATRVGRYLEGQGLSVSVKGAPIGEVQREIDEYKQKAESKSKEYGLNLEDKDVPCMWSLQ